ncbi:hypothetical protein FXO38_01938 [Capsicum annuum]|nr:hypothetical protein FXO37_27469 [Capsicum annuum]KAF3681058.1 hypothetical protein FXO38_01938 [Capsicum annuum]
MRCTLFSLRGFVPLGFPYNNGNNCDSRYDFNENIDDLSYLNEKFLQARQSNIKKQVKQKTDRVKLDDIPSGSVGIDAAFEEIYNNKKARFEGELDGNDPYFDSSNPDNDVSEEEGDHVDDDEVVVPPPRMSQPRRGKS